MLKDKKQYADNVKYHVIVGNRTYVKYSAQIKTPDFKGKALGTIMAENQLQAIHNNFHRHDKIKDAQTEIEALKNDDTIPADKKADKIKNAENSVRLWTDTLEDEALYA